MANWKSNPCPKCGGSLFLDIDETGYFDHCLQCGYTRCRSMQTCPQCGAVMEYANSAYHCLNCEGVEIR